MRNVKTWGILFLCLLLLPGVAYAQKRLIEGTVISQEDKEPLIGATVIVKGSLSGAETDLDGHFTLEVDPDAKFIIVDYIGMKQTQVPIPKSGILNVALQPEAMNLDEVAGRYGPHMSARLRADYVLLPVYPRAGGAKKGKSLLDI